MTEILAARLSVIDDRISKLEQGVLNQIAVATVEAASLEVTNSGSSRTHARKDQRRKANHKYECARSQLLTLMPRSVLSMDNESANIKQNFALLESDVPM